MASKKNASKKQSKNATVLANGSLLVPNQMPPKLQEKSAFEFPTRKSVASLLKNNEMIINHPILREFEAAEHATHSVWVALKKKPKTCIGYVEVISTDGSVDVGVEGVTHKVYHLKDLVLHHRCSFQTADETAELNRRLTDKDKKASTDSDSVSKSNGKKSKPKEKTEVVMTADGLVEVLVEPVSPMKKRTTFADLPLLTGFSVSPTPIHGRASFAWVKVGNSTAIRTVVVINKDGQLTISLSNMRDDYIPYVRKERFQKTKTVYPVVAADSTPRSETPIVP